MTQHPATLILGCVSREDGVAVITPSYEDIALEITVTNRNGDDAHQSHIIITLPETLHYSSAVYNTVSISNIFISFILNIPLKDIFEVSEQM